MNIKTLCTSLFVIITLVAGQVSFGMEKPGAKKKTKKIKFTPVVCAPPETETKTIDFSKENLRYMGYDKRDKNKILFQVEEGYYAYDLENDSSKKFNGRIKYSYNFPTMCGQYGLSRNGKTVMVTSPDPLYAVEHNGELLFATFNTDNTKLITGSRDGEVRISTIEKPIIVKCKWNFIEEISIACNPHVACMSQVIKESSSEQLLLPLTYRQFNYAYHLMTLLYKDDSDSINAFNAFLKNLNELDIEVSCELATTCNDLKITSKNNINLAHTICESIAQRYNPTTDSSYVETLPQDLQSIILEYKRKTDDKPSDDKPSNDEQPNNNNKQTNENLGSAETSVREVVNTNDQNPTANDVNLVKKDTGNSNSSKADPTGLSGFFSTPFINKKWLWAGISIGSFVAATATLFCYYKYFKQLPKIF